MSDVAVVALAVATWVGAALAWPVPRWLGVVVALGALGLRKPWLVVVGGAVLAAGTGAVAVDGLRVDAGEVGGWATLVEDPVGVRGGLRVEVRLDGMHLDAWARGTAASGLRERLAGDRVALTGRVTALRGRAAEIGRSRHVGGRLEVQEAGPWQPGAPASRVANRVRDHLEAGSRSMEAGRQALLLGMTVGDDRGQSDETRAAFRAAGLSHLTAVSGQNLAYVLLLAGPLLRRLPGWARWGATALVLLLFAVLTRWEPSVLRAVVMAGLAATTLVIGRPASRMRLLGLAVTALVLLDPLLVASLGFRLSVAATLGITLLAAPLASALPGPRALRELLGVTVAAQVGVAPVVLATFGGLPLGAVPANLLAVPMAGFVTAWGLVVVPLAGAIGGRSPTLVCMPVEVVAWWIGEVASRFAAHPLGVITPRWAIATGLLAGVLLVGRRRRAGQ